MNSKHQLAAILFADIEGYSAMMQSDEKQALSWRKRFEENLDVALKMHTGKLISLTGDGALCAFPSAISAIHAGILIQHELRKYPIVPLRIGIHQGDVIIADHAVYGDGVNIASRIESFAIPGSILISGKVYDDIKNQSDISAKFLGNYRLKNIHDPVSLYAISNSGLQLPTKGALTGKGKLMNASNKRRWQVLILVSIILLLLTLMYILNSPGEKTVKEPSLAVLYFENMSGEPEQEYFSDGVTEEIISHVSKINGIRVMSNNAVLPYKGSKPDLRKLANELHVNYIMTGLVRVAGNTYKIMASLIDPQTGTSLWSESYQHDLSDIFQTQSAIAIQVANMLAVEISPHSKNTIETIPTRIPEAYNFFRKGKYVTYQQYLNSHTQADFDRAKSYFEQAIALDPMYAEPYAGLAELYDELHNHTGDQFPDSLHRLQMDFARTAMKLNPNSSYVNTAMAWTIDHSGSPNPDSSFQYLNRAYQLDPNDALNLFNMAYQLSVKLAVPEIGLPFIEKAIVFDPLDPNLYVFKGRLLGVLGRKQEALQNFHAAIDLAEHHISQENPLIFWLINYEEYDVALKRLIDNIDQNTIPWAIYYVSTAQPEKIDKKFMDLPFIQFRLHPEKINHAWLNEIEKEMEQGNINEFNHYLNLKVSPILKAFHQDPHYQVVLEKARTLYETNMKKYRHVTVLP